MTVQLDHIIPYLQTAKEVISSLDTDARNGLSVGEAGERLKKYGKNELMAESLCLRGGNSWLSSMTYLSSAACCNPYIGRHVAL